MVDYEKYLARKLEESKPGRVNYTERLKAHIADVRAIIEKEGDVSLDTLIGRTPREHSRFRWDYIVEIDPNPHIRWLANLGE
ncbi:hypothetical protein HYU95_02745 [Candidatus Daviesbacteria bacterium]|nr:hypothetical protein [Candidatus Daviesbacteria bacterium]